VKEGAEKVKIAGSKFEGSYIYKRGKYYYFFGSIGSCCEGDKSTYRTVYGRSESLLGPYVTKNGTTLLNNGYEVLIQGNSHFAGTGHNAEIVEDDNGTTWILYHAYEKGVDSGRQVLLDRVLWTDDGWPYCVNSEPSDISVRPYFN
jgi:arabinan endo-1,5-alpha-L-arabinosidase